MHTDWHDGFLFIGNQLSLDFLNTRPILDGGPTELLPDCASLARWLKAAGLVSRPNWPGGSSCESMLIELLEFRERLRETILQIEAGGAPRNRFTAEINQLLAAHPYLDKVTGTGRNLARGKRFEPATPRDVFAPIVDNVATLLTVPDKSRLRMCQTCVLHFYDTSKKGTRVWCSMNMCGNRSKVAAYASRNR